jgi:NAD(P)-dependent dehydrogenase (short-subunit alcohol dehydrogenase family)
MRIIITGASSGIGRAAAIELAKQGHDIAVVGRTAERVREVAAEVGGDPFVADFDSLAAVRGLAAELLAAYPKIDGLANNAGGVIATRALTQDGHERTWQSNVLAPFVLTQALLPRLLESAARVVFTSSGANSFENVDVADPNHDRGLWLRGFSAYGQAKRADLMLAKEYARRTPLHVYSFHPGAVATRFGGLDATPLAPLIRRVIRTPAQGAALLVRLLTETPDVASGSYFTAWDKPDKGAAKQALDAAEGAKLWELLEQQRSAFAWRAMKPVDEYFSREERFSLGVDDASGQHYLSFPVTIGVADYSEFYALDDASYRDYLEDPLRALPFLAECRNREHDELLLQKPGWNRGIPM